MRDKFIKILAFSKAHLIIILALLLILTSAMDIYFYRALSELRENPQKAVQAETQKMLAKIAKLIILPDDEQPTIATVSDPDQLKGQPFFEKAKKGDKVLIYAAAGKSILYDPIANKILEVTSINTGTNPTSLVTPTPTKNPKQL